MRTIWEFISEWFREWWGLMGCAAFTFLGIYVAAANKSNAWIVASSAALGYISFFTASYRAWKRQHDRSNEERVKRELEEAKNTRPSLRGEVFDFQTQGLYGESNTPNCFTGIACTIYMCNERNVVTTLKEVIFDGSALQPRWTPENRPYVDTSKPANEIAEVRTRSVIPWDA